MASEKPIKMTAMNGSIAPKHPPQQTKVARSSASNVLDAGDNEGGP